MNQVFLVVTDQGIVQTRDEAGDSVEFQGRSGKKMVVPETAVSDQRMVYERKSVKEGEDHLVREDRQDADPGMDMEDKMIKEEIMVKRYERQNETVPVHIITLKKEENKRE